MGGRRPFKAVPLCAEWFTGMARAITWAKVALGGTGTEDYRFKVKAGQLT
jgi:hypothetical protein